MASISPNRAVTRTGEPAASSPPAPPRRRLRAGAAARRQRCRASRCSTRASPGATRACRRAALLGLQARHPCAHRRSTSSQLGKGLTDLGWVAGSDLSAGNRLMLDGTASRRPVAACNRRAHCCPTRTATARHVASIAAGSGALPVARHSGIGAECRPATTSACSNENGVGNLADVIAGIDWVIQHAHAAEHPGDEPEPRRRIDRIVRHRPAGARARAAVASGIVVVVAAGNAGKTADGREVYGAVGSPGHDPSVITVGAANPRATAARERRQRRRLQLARPDARPRHAGRRTVDRQPAEARPRGAGQPHRRRAVGRHLRPAAAAGTAWSRTYPQLASVPGACAGSEPDADGTERHVGGCAGGGGCGGAVAAGQPGADAAARSRRSCSTRRSRCRGANLLQQGVGQLNVEGAPCAWPRRCAPTSAPALAAGTLRAGDPLLAAGATAAGAAIHDRRPDRSTGARLVVAGGNHLLSGDALFTQLPADLRPDAQLDAPARAAQHGALTGR